MPVIYFSQAPISFEINGIQFGSMVDDMEGHLRKWIAHEIVTRNASDEQIYSYLLRTGYHDKDMITRHINWVRNFTYVPDPSGAKRKRNPISKVRESTRKEKHVGPFTPPLPDNMICHFIKGVFEGDGTINPNERPRKRGEGVTYNPEVNIVSASKQFT